MRRRLVAWLNGRSVRWRFTAIVSVVLALVTVLVFQYYPRQLERLTRQATEDRARGLARSVAIGVSVGLEVLDLGAISEAFELARNDPDFLAVQVTDAEEQVVGRFGAAASALSEPEDLRVNVPIVYQGADLGEVELWMSLDRMRAAITSQRLAGLGICAAIFALGVLLTSIASRPITDPLAELVNAADQVAEGNLSAPLPPANDSEIGRLAGAFEHMRNKVRNALGRLEDQSNEMQVMLDHLDDGLFTFNTDLSINPQHSRRVRDILGIEDVASADWSEIFPVEPETFDTFREWVQLISNRKDDRNLQQYERLNPIEAIFREGPDGPRYIRVSCSPIFRGPGQWRFLVLLTDETERRRAQDALEAKDEEQKLDSERVLGLVRSERQDVDDLLSGCATVLQLLEGGWSEEENGLGLIEIRREVHTLKGNSGSLGFTKLSQVIGSVEDPLYDQPHVATTAESDMGTAIGALRVELEKIEAWRTLLFSDRSDRMGVDREAFEVLIGDLGLGLVRDPGEILERIRYLPARPLSDYSRRYARFVEGYRRSYGKNLADLVVDTPNVLILPDTMREIDPSIVQLLRNAADHGIESDSERQARGRGEGRITLAARYVDGWLEMSVADNGRGIDGEALVQAAVRAGVIDEQKAAGLSETERVNLAIRSGVTTRAKAGAMSGRGVGLDVVASAVRQLGGELTIRTEVGGGSEVRLRMPVANELHPPGSIQTGREHGSDLDRGGQHVSVEDPS